MKKFIPILKRSLLFRGVGEEEIALMLGCLDATCRTYRKGEYVLHRGDAHTHVTLLVEGELHVRRDDYWGNGTIVNRIAEGEMFGESYLSPDAGVLLTDVVATRESTVLFFDVLRLLSTCSSACRFHATVVQNLFFAISEKNRRLVQKLGHLSRRTTREKLISYLSEEATRQSSAEITIPFNRQQLADFLSVDRSAMSNELCKMRDEGLLEFSKNRFRLL